MSSKRYIVRRMRVPMRKECVRSIEEECLDRRLASVNLGRQCPNTLRSSILTGIIKGSGRRSSVAPRSAAWVRFG